MLSREQLFPISNSRLTAFKRSPKHLIQYFTEDKTPTSAMEFGAAFHMALLEPESFNEFYAIAPECDRRTKEGKELYAYFSSKQNPLTKVITYDDGRKIANMIDSILSNPVAAELLQNCPNREKTVLWDNMETMLPMRGIIDAYCDDYIIDIKTTTDAQPHKFQRDAYYMDYHRQAAIYMDALPHVKEFYLIAIEKDAPYGVSVHRMDQALIDKGRDQYLNLLQEYSNWVNNECPDQGYEYWHVCGIHDMSLPYATV